MDYSPSRKLGDDSCELSPRLSGWRQIPTNTSQPYWAREWIADGRKAEGMVSMRPGRVESPPALSGARGVDGGI